jgi:hypothetical protein
MKKLLALLLFACCSADAQITRTDEQEIAGVIDRMFVAVQRGDDDTMFALQTDDTRQSFGSPREFGAALRRCCTALHETVKEILVTMDGSTERVTAYVLMIDGDDDRWSAQFILEKHKVWQIDEIHIKLIDQTGSGEMQL